MTNIRKNLIILVFVLSGVVITLLIFNFGKTNQNKKAGIVNTRTNISENLPVKLSKAVVSSFSFKNQLNNIIFYEKTDSIIYETNYDGKNKQELVRIPQNIDPTIAPNGEKIVYHFYNSSKDFGEIFLANLDGSEPISIFKTRIKNMRILWPENDLVVFYSISQNGPIEAFSLKPNGKELKKLTEEEFNFYLNNNSKLSPLKDYLIFINAKDGKLYSLKL